MRLFRILPSPSAAFAPIPLPLAPAGLAAGISLRASGDLRLGSPDREAFFQALGVPPERHYACRQVHSRRVLWIGDQGPPVVAEWEADGLASGRADRVLSVTVADCLPIFVYDRRGGAFALLHSGWKGTGIVTEAVRLLTEEHGAYPASLAAVFGPGIGACCYAVDAERAALFRRQYGERAVRVEPGGRSFLDLRAANAALLEAAGVWEVHAAAECTACTPELFSFRRDGPGFGRMAAFIGVIPQ
jgi:YfiH family protein